SHAAHAVLQPCADQWSLHEVLHISRHLWRFDDANPAVAIRILQHQAGIFDRFMVHGGDDAFDRRQQLDRHTFAGQGHELLSLANPAVQSADFDALDVAEQVRGKAVETDAGILATFIEHPSVSGMEGIALRNFKAELTRQLGSRRTRSRRLNLNCSFNAVTTEISNRDKKKER